MRRILNYIRRFLQKDVVADKNTPPDIIDDLRLLSEGKVNVIFDIGAHHGRYAKKIAEVISLNKCYCFEPFPSSFQILKQNLDDKKFSVHQLALSDAKGRATFYANNFDETNSLLPSVKTNSQIDNLITTRDKIEVEVNTVDEFCAANGIDQIDILKIDAQGNTFNVLTGGKRLLETGSIKLIQCEVEFIEIYQEEKLFHKIADFMEVHGYKLYSIYNLHFDINKRLSWGDAIFTKA